MFHIHKWNTWEPVSLSIQKRSCKKCGVTQTLRSQHIHDWGKWTQGPGVRSNRYGAVDNITVNVRYCDTCGYEEVR